MALTPPRRVSDAEYLARYERKVRRYVIRYQLARAVGIMGPGEAFLSRGRWAWIEGDATHVARRQQYARKHSGLKAMNPENPDGTWRDWQPRGGGWRDRSARHDAHRSAGGYTDMDKNELIAMTPMVLGG